MLSLVMGAHKRQKVNDTKKADIHFMQSTCSRYTLNRMILIKNYDYYSYAAGSLFLFNIIDIIRQCYNNKDIHFKSYDLDAASVTVHLFFSHTKSPKHLFEHQFVIEKVPITLASRKIHIS